MSLTVEQRWWPSPFGEGDELGMLNHIDDAKRLQAASLIHDGRVFDLGRVLDETVPVFPGHFFRQTLVTTAHHANASGGIGDNDVNWVTEQVAGTMQLGTHLDALSHLQIGQRGYNGWSVAELASDAGMKRLGVETVPQIVTRGWLVDVPRTRGVDRLEVGDVIEIEDLGEVEPEAGDAVLFHTGWGAHWDEPELYLTGEPGPGLALAAFLADRGVALTGCDTWSYGPVPPEDPDPFLRRFMLRTSVLERLHARLCDALTGDDDGQERLEQLDRDNLFVIPLDSNRRWYRYHQLFADVLRSRLEHEQPGATAELHRLAAAWYAENGFPEDAIRHSLAGEDRDTAARLVAAHWSESFHRGRLATVAHWLDALPVERLRSDSRLWLARVWTAMDRGRLDEIQPWLEEPSGSPGGLLGGEAGEREAWAELLRGLHRFKMGELRGARESAALIEGAGADQPVFWRTVAKILAALSRYWSGDRGGGRRGLRGGAVAGSR